MSDFYAHISGQINSLSIIHKRNSSLNQQSNSLTYSCLQIIICDTCVRVWKHTMMKHRFVLVLIFNLSFKLIMFFVVIPFRLVT